MMGRRNGAGRGIRDRMTGDGRFTDRAVLNGVHFRLNAVANRVAFSAYRMAFGANAVDMDMRQDDDDPDFPQNAPDSNQFA